MILASPSAVKLREYERIYTGTNQETGYENPILNFVSNTTLQVLPTDKTTYFHYPITAPSGLLIDSDLFNCGAIAGNVPYNSDKIWKKMANYKSTSIWGTSQPIGKQTGVWLCSWLSGCQLTLSGTSGYIDSPKPVWKDRWYNPGYIDPTTSMMIANAPSSVIVDIDSEMTFDGGCLYKYYHIGSNKNQLIVNDLSANNALKLHLEDWLENTTDSSIYNNTVILNNYTADMISYKGVNDYDRPEDSCISLNGIDQDCQVLNSSSYQLSGNMSYSIWAHAKDWDNVQGNHIISKNFRGGWDLKYSNGFFTPVLTVLDRNNGNAGFFNSDASILDSKTLPGTSVPVAALVDDNLFTWVLDNGVYDDHKHLYKIDYNGDIRDVIEFPSTANLADVTIDGNNNLWVLESNTGNVSGFNETGDYIGRKNGIVMKVYDGFTLTSPESSFLFAHLRNNVRLAWDSYGRESAYDPIVPGIYSNLINTKWYAELEIPTTGTYEFKFVGDDYIEIHVGNTVLSSNWYDYEVLSSVSLQAGTSSLFIQHTQGIGTNFLSLMWKKPADVGFEYLTNYIYPSGSGITNIDSDLSNTIVGSSRKTFIDNNNTTWFTNSNAVWNWDNYFEPIYQSNTNISDIKCDKDNNLWILQGANEFYKYSTTENVVLLSGTVGTSTQLSGRSINFTNEFIDGEYKDFVWFLQEAEQNLYKFDTEGNQIKRVSLVPYDINPYTLGDFTGYQKHRKYDYLRYNKIPQLKAEIQLNESPYISNRYTLSVPTTAISNNDWHMFTFTCSPLVSTELCLYVDGIIRDHILINTPNYIYYEYENALRLGTNTGKTNPLAKELDLTQMYFKGKLDDLRIYDRVLNNSDIRYIYLNKFDYHDLKWNMPTGNQSYLEEIERFFKFKLPGAKSQYYNIRLIGLQITDENTRTMIEDIIKNTIKKIAPAYAELYKIVWE
jgi:hypothetical protein